MQIHAHLRRAIEAHARAAKPGISAADLEAIVAKVAGSEQFAGSADFLDDSLIALVHSDLPLVVKAFTLRHATAPTPTAPDARQDIPPDVWARMTPQQKLGRHYQAEAGERPDIESAALAERAGREGAKPYDVLAHHRATTAPATKEERRAADNPKVNTADLAVITNPNKRHAAYRGRVADTRAKERLKLDQAAYQRKALDPSTPPNIRAQANLELSRINERLKALGGE